AAAGVSLKTVSRVVNGEAGVRPETAAAVNEAIAHLGFRRNYIARALRPGQRSHMLGLVIEDVSNPFYSAIFRGVEEIARSAGYLVITASSDEDPEREQALVHLFCERRVEGLIVVPAGDDHRYMLPEIRAGTGVVFVDRPPGVIEADAVLLDNVGGARSAVRHLLGLGHRRIAMLGDEERIFTAGERLRGYREEMAAAGKDVDPALVHLGAHDADAAEAATRGFMALTDPPTAIFTANNRITVGAIRVLWQNGFRTALVGFDDLELAESLAVPATVVGYDAAELGREAARLLLLRLAGDTSPPRRVVLPTWLVERGSGEVRS
ncbi:MAG: LacI family DNA-binding transcriptional regulator, partial [Gaiellaceae bacterium]